MKRFMVVMRWNIMANRKEIRKMVFGTPFVFLLVYMILVFGEYSFKDRHMIDPASVTRDMAYWSLFVIVMYIVVYASLFLRNMKTREQRVAFLMLPASATEKFVTRWLYVTVGSFVVIVMAMLVADLVFALFCLLSWPELLGSVTLATLRAFTDSMSNTWDMCVKWQGVTGAYIRMAYAVVLALTVHSFFLFCSAKCRRNPLLPAWAFTISAMYIGTATGNFPYLGLSLADAMHWDENAVVLGSTVVLLGMTVLFYWGSYRLLKRIQVIDNSRIRLLIKL